MENMMQHHRQGFTLIELMVVVVIIAIFAAIAIPSYQEYIRRSNLAMAQQEMQKLAEQLERYRSRNFSYKGFDATYLYQDKGGQTLAKFDSTKQIVQLPLDTSNTKYTLAVVDTTTNNPLLTSANAIGQGWAVTAKSADTNNYSLLMTNTGLRCKNKTWANISSSSCGTGSESW